MFIKECKIMSLALEMEEIANHLANHLNEQEKFVVIEIMKRFLPDNVATDEDLQDIENARIEYMNNETTSHNDIDWD